MEENNEKLQKVLDYFEEIGVEIPTPVKNSIEDVFDENDQIDTVDLYMKEDAETFMDEASFKDMVIVDLSENQLDLDITRILTMEMFFMMRIL